MATKSPRATDLVLNEIWAAGQARGLNRQDVCRLAKIHPNYATQLFNPHISTLHRLAKALGGQIKFVCD